MSEKSSLVRKNIVVILKKMPFSPRAVYLFFRKFPPLLYMVNKAIMLMIPEKIILHGGVIFLNKKDPVISGALMFDVYESAEIDSWRKKIKPTSIVLDIGSNIGIYSIIAGKIAKKGKVIAFEPEKENIDFLKKSINANELNNVSVVEKGVSDTSGEGLLGLSRDNKGKHSLLESATKESTQKISLTTIDEEVKNFSLPRVDLIKIDVEGWEAKVISGMEETVKKFHPEILFEFAPMRIKESGIDPMIFMKKISDHGYLFFNAENKDSLEFTMEDAAALCKKDFFDTFINLWAIPKKIS